jgi:hypothetical protein
MLLAFLVLASPLVSGLPTTPVAHLISQEAPALAVEGEPAISGGALSAISNASVEHVPEWVQGAYLRRPVFLDRIFVDKRFDSMKFDDNSTENGVRFIPPDPIGAAGYSRIIAAVNGMIEVRTKEGTFVWREGLRDFFAPLSPASRPFDPKIVYDAHRQRFVVVALELITGTASVSADNISRILLAVSKRDNPRGPTSADWNYHAINSKVVIPRPVTPFDHWADYPGFEVDEEAIYVTANMFTFVPFGSFGGVRLWIVDKGAGSGGFYDGGPAAVSLSNPYAGGGIATTTMPAEVRTAGGAGPGIGTYLVSYSGLSDGVDEYVQVVRVDDPLGRQGGPSFTQEFVRLANLETGFPALPDAPQADSTFLIEVNDRRALDAVWQHGKLYLTTTLRPNAGPDLNQTTAYWVAVDTSGVQMAGDAAGLLFVDQQGSIGGEDIAPGTFTYFPALAVNRLGAVSFGFSASAPTIFAGAFVTGRSPFDVPGTVRQSEVVREGVAPYKRFFSGPRNRWGDYSGMAVDPSNDDFYWVFNEYADEPGSPTNGSQGPEDGRWGTAWARAKFVGGGTQ